MSEVNHMLLRVEYHSPDNQWCAVWIRGGEPWFLNGALVGLDSTPGTAVDSLIGISIYLVVHGENFLSEGPISMDDRLWLYYHMQHIRTVYDDGEEGLGEEDMYRALRQAGVDKPWLGPSALHCDS